MLPCMFLLRRSNMINIEKLMYIKEKQPLLFNELVEVAGLILNYEFTPNGEYDLLSDESKRIFQRRRNRFFSVIFDNNIMNRNGNELLENLRIIMEQKAC